MGYLWVSQKHRSADCLGFLFFFAFFVVIVFFRCLIVVLSLHIAQGLREQVLDFELN
jgi:hypothetical protein